MCALYTTYPASMAPGCWINGGELGQAGRKLLC